MLIPLTSSAQASINDVVRKIENRKDVDYVTYTEKRNPSSRRVYESTKIIVITSETDSKKLIQAFMDSRQSSYSFEIGGQGKYYKIEFSRNGETSIYTLVKQRNRWLLTIKINNSRYKPDKSQSSVNLQRDELRVLHDEFGCTYILD